MSVTNALIPAVQAPTASARTATREVADSGFAGVLRGQWRAGWQAEPPTKTLTTPPTPAVAARSEPTSGAPGSLAREVAARERVGAAGSALAATPSSGTAPSASPSARPSPSLAMRADPARASAARASASASAQAQARVQTQERAQAQAGARDAQGDAASSDADPRTAAGRRAEESARKPAAHAHKAARSGLAEAQTSGDDVAGGGATGSTDEAARTGPSAAGATALEAASAAAAAALAGAPVPGLPVTPAGGAIASGELQADPGDETLHDRVLGSDVEGAPGAPDAQVADPIGALARPLPSGQTPSLAAGTAARAPAVQDTGPAPAAPEPSQRYAEAAAAVAPVGMETTGLQDRAGSAWQAVSPSLIGVAEAPVATAVTVGAAVHEPGFADEVSLSVSSFVRSGIEQATLQLNPAEMGPVEVSIRMDGTQATVGFTAAREDTRTALASSLADLERRLQADGLVLSDAWVAPGSAPPAADDPPAPGSDASARGWDSREGPAGGNGSGHPGRQERGAAPREQRPPTPDGAARTRAWDLQVRADDGRLLDSAARDGSRGRLDLYA